MRDIVFRRTIIIIRTKGDAMGKRRLVIYICLLGVALFGALETVVYTSIASAQDELTVLQRGRGKSQMCTRCHGRLGLARAAKGKEWEGEVQGFIILNLTQFRDGTRMHAVMNSIASPLTDLDINDIAIWYEDVSGFKETH